MKTIAFFNNKGGVGKTSLVYHLGWIFADQGMRVLMVDLDPQSNLTAMCVDEERMEQLWVDDDMERKSMRGAVQPIIDGVGDIQPAHIEALGDRQSHQLTLFEDIDIQPAHMETLSSRLAVLPGDIRLSEFEQKLSDAWPRCMDRDPAAFRTVTSFYRIIQASAAEHDAEIVLIDVGPNLGAINRSALIAAEFVATPMGADLFSIQGLRNLGPTLVKWRDEWKKRLAENPIRDINLPDGAIRPVGYIVMQPNLYGGQVTHAYDRWLKTIPSVYREFVLQRSEKNEITVENDPSCLAVLRHYRSLMPMAQASRKPIFKLSAAEGAIGAHSKAVLQVGKEFLALGERLLDRSITHTE